MSFRGARRRPGCGRRQKFGLLSLLELFLLTLNGFLSAFILLFLNLEFLRHHPFGRNEILHLPFKIFDFVVDGLPVFSRRRAEGSEFAIRSVQLIPQLAFRFLQNFQLPIQGLILDPHAVEIAFRGLKVLQSLLVRTLTDDASRHQCHGHQQAHGGSRHAFLQYAFQRT